MPRYDLTLRGGTLVDGTGAPRRAADLGIVGGVIERIGDLGAHSSAREIDASGRIVAPGVIDLHTHYDAQLHWDPYCTNTSWHGGTTVAVGNCGFGFAPCAPELRERAMRMMENTEQVPYPAMRRALGWDWVTFPDWIGHLKKQPKGINLASYLPLNPLLIFVMGLEAAKKRAPSAEERGRMRDLLEQAMDHGAIGFAFSHLGGFNSHVDADGTPMPTDTMAVETAYFLAEVLRERGEGCIQALTDIPGGVDNRHVSEELARRSGRPIVHNVIAAFDQLPDFHEDRLRWLDDCHARGLDVWGQSICLRVWNELRVPEWNAWDSVPLFRELSNCGDEAAKLARVRDSAYLARARTEYDPAAMYASGGALESFILHAAHGASAYVAHEGKLVGEIASQLGRPVTDVFFELLSQSEMAAEFRTTEALSADPVKNERVLRHPRVLPGTSDGGAHVKFYSGGQYPTEMIAWLVREERRFTLEEVHARTSALPARVAGLHRRGTLEPGQWADLYVYDFERIGYVRGRYEVRHDLPGGDWRRVAPAHGIDWVLVNGEPIFRGAECTGALPGRLVSNRGEAVDEWLRRVA